MQLQIPQPTKFELGHLVATPTALERVAPADLHQCVLRHTSGDWGELCDEDRQVNEEALLHGGRLFSLYSDFSGVRFYIITECDRSATTVLLPEDY